MLHNQDKWESVLVEIIFPDLERGRQDFDLPHTKAVVYWMKQILGNEPQLNEKILVTAAYAHDWGYIDMGITNTVSMKAVHEAKERHMEVGAARIEALLKDKLADQYTKEEIMRVKHLVYVHDRLKEVKDDDEIAIVEADTLGALDTDLVKPTFSKEDNDLYIKEQVLGIRRPLFRHRVAVDRFDELLEKRVRYYDLVYSR